MSRYNSSQLEQPAKLDVDNNRRFYETLIDPTIPRSYTDVYIISSFGDRLDLLAGKYYSDPSLWWMISAANPELRKDSIYLEPGVQVRIPTDYIEIFDLFKTNNLSR
jgi:hypothetical protein